MQAEAGTVVIYHASCVDGFTAAWCAWRALGVDGVEYVPAHYGDKPPDVSGKAVCVLDFSYPRDVLLAMRDKARSLVVLDHHKTSKEALDGLAFCIFDMGKSGAMLAWEYFWPMLSEEAALVRYVQDRDLWRWELQSSKEISAYIATIDRTFQEWSRLAEDLQYRFDECVARGAVALRVTDHYVETKAKPTYLANCAGYEVPIVNTTFAVSELVGTLAKGHPFAIGWFSPGPGEYVYSLRSRGEGTDVSEVAKKFGGGGHRGAAGFKSDRPPEALFAVRGTGPSSE